MLLFELCPFNFFFKNFTCQNLNFHSNFGFILVLKLISNLDISKPFSKKKLLLTLLYQIVKSIAYKICVLNFKKNVCVIFQYVLNGKHLETVVKCNLTSCYTYPCRLQLVKNNYQIHDTNFSRVKIIVNTKKLERRFQ